MSEPNAVEQSREAVAGELCEARYWLHPASNHHDVHTCAACYALVDALIAAVEAKARADERMVLADRVARDLADRNSEGFDVKWGCLYCPEYERLMRLLREGP